MQAAEERAPRAAAGVSGPGPGGSSERLRLFVGDGSRWQSWPDEHLCARKLAQRPPTRPRHRRARHEPPGPFDGPRRIPSWAGHARGRVLVCKLREGHPGRRASNGCEVGICFCGRRGPPASRVAGRGLSNSRGRRRWLPGGRVRGTRQPAVAGLDRLPASGRPGAAGGQPCSAVGVAIDARALAGV